MYVMIIKSDDSLPIQFCLDQTLTLGEATFDHVELIEKVICFSDYNLVTFIVFVTHEDLIRRRETKRKEFITLLTY